MDREGPKSPHEVGDLRETVQTKTTHRERYVDDGRSQRVAATITGTKGWRHASRINTGSTLRRCLVYHMDKDQHADWTGCRCDDEDSARTLTGVYGVFPVPGIAATMPGKAIAIKGPV
jgi:hypothetical protein